MGSIVGARLDLQETQDLADDGVVRAIIQTARLEDIDAVFDNPARDAAYHRPGEQPRLHHRGRDPRGAVQQDQELGLRRADGRADQPRGGGPGAPRRTAGELAAAFKTALGHDGPCLIEVDIDPTDCSPTMRSGELASRRPTGSHLEPDRSGR